MIDTDPPDTTPEPVPSHANRRKAAPSANEAGVAPAGTTAHAGALTDPGGGQRWLRADIRTAPLPPLSWISSNRETALHEVYRHVRVRALDAIRWYRQARRPKRRIAVTARFMAVLFLAAAGILPLLEQVIPGTIPSIWVSMLVAAGAGVLAFDRFYGGSTGWIRYIRSETKLRAALETFELDWEEERAGWGGGEPTTEQVHSMLEKARAFAAQVNGLVQDETEAWVEEFQRSIQQIDKALQAKAERAEEERAAQKPGAINLTVTNGDHCDDGWTVEVELDGANIVEQASGKSFSLPDVPPGIRVVGVAGSIGGQKSNARAAVKVPAGAVVDQAFTLT